MINMINQINILGASEVSANLYCNSRTSVLGRLRDYFQLLMKRFVNMFVFHSLTAKRKKTLRPFQKSVVTFYACMVTTGNFIMLYLSKKKENMSK